MPNTLQKTVRVTQEQWNRVENAANERSITHKLVNREIDLPNFAPS